MEVEKSTPKAQKPLNKSLKYIWFVISVAVLLAGILLVKLGVPFESFWVRAVYAAAVLVPLLIAAQKISCERVKEDGKKNPVAFILYYLCIILFVILIPFTLWVDQFIS